MLDPDTSVVLTQALQPPAGFRIDESVTTTYSLNLTAMLIAPMTFALGDVDDARTLNSGDPVLLLDAIKRHIAHTHVFCQAAGIHIPSSHSRLHAFLEDSIFQVEPEVEGALFHPKFWALRFVRDSDGALHHRVVIASRNLTLDSSWDTALVLDESPHGSIDASPAADFVSQLPKLCTRPLPDERVESIDRLATTLRSASLEPPYPFSGGTLLALGLSDDRVWPLVRGSDRLFAISPFVTRGILDRLSAGTVEAILLSRPESLDQIGARSAEGWDLQVLSSGTELGDQTGAETTVVDEFTSTARQGTVPFRTHELAGLHAKTIIADFADGQSIVVTGSANLTSAAWEANVEFDAVLSGPTSTCGVEAVLGRESGDTGLQMVMEPYTPKNDEPTQDPEVALGYRLEQFHRDLVSSTPRPRLDVVSRDDGSVSVRLTLLLPDEVPGETEIWLSTVPGQKRPAAETTIWNIALENITPFIAVETRVQLGDSAVARRCILKVEIVGDPLERRQRALSEILSNSERVLSYLALLLGIDAPPSSTAANLERFSEATVVGSAAIAADVAPQPPPIVLFEPLVRAVGNDLDQLASIAERIKEIREVPDVDALIPAEFLQMWDVVLSVISERPST